MLERTAELSVAAQDVELWAASAPAEADRIDPLRNGTVVESIAGVTKSLEPDRSERTTLLGALRYLLTIRSYDIKSIT